MAGSIRDCLFVCFDIIRILCNWNSDGRRFSTTATPWSHGALAVTIDVRVARRYVIRCDVWMHDNDAHNRRKRTPVINRGTAAASDVVWPLTLVAAEFASDNGAQRRAEVCQCVVTLANLTRR